MKKSWVETRITEVVCAAAMGVLSALRGNAMACHNGFSSRSMAMDRCSTELVRDSAPNTRVIYGIMSRR